MSRAIDIIVAPYDSGLRSVRMGRGPEALLDAGLVERLERRGATVRTNMVEVDAAPHGIPSEIAAAVALQREVARWGGNSPCERSRSVERIDRRLVRIAGAPR